MIGVFNSKVAAFNKAVNENDYDQISEIGVEMLQIALDQCSKGNISSSLRDRYIREGMSVVRYLANLAKKSSAPIKASNGSGDGEGDDPYYVEKQWFSDEVPQLTFKDIIGVQEVKDAFMVDVVAPLRPEFKDVYKKFRGNQMGSQILLYGPPGTGKTHIVKCLAGALNCKIAVVQTSEVLASIVGVAEKNIRDVFKQAAELKRCIIFFDEIDSICSDRDSIDSRNTKSVLTTLLTCMDGFLKTTNEGQLRIIVAATNLPWKLDPALKRGGRFETQIYVPLPDEKARREFVNKALSKLPHDNDVTVDWLSEQLTGYSGADINAVMKQIANKPLQREVKNILNPAIGKAVGEKVKVSDCNEVISQYINSVSQEMLDRFNAYDRGISYEEYLMHLNGLK